ncbi:MAG: SDR family NAD(P)-dependent oxidoreductase [Cellvibrionaceae bacterium]
MKKTILITGSTDGIGLETAKMLAAEGHQLLIHGRSTDKLARTQEQLAEIPNSVKTECYAADLSKLQDVNAMATAIAQNHQRLDVVINNAGVFNLANPVAENGQDLRFVVNTLAPYLLTQKLLPLLDKSSRVVNLSSAAQAPVDLAALRGEIALDDGQAYAQSKLALTMWSRNMGLEMKDTGPVIIAVNPKSFLGSKMVKQAYGVAGGDLSIGADVLSRAALSDEFTKASGQYYDNDIGQFSSPNPDALDSAKCQPVINTIREMLKDLL